MRLGIGTQHYGPTFVSNLINTQRGLTNCYYKGEEEFGSVKQTQSVGYIQSTKPVRTGKMHEMTTFSILITTTRMCPLFLCHIRLGVLSHTTRTLTNCPYKGDEDLT